MWALTALVLAAVAAAILVGILMKQSRSNELRRRRIVQILRAAGDDGVPPTTLDDSIGRLESTAPTAAHQPASPVPHLLSALDEMPTGAVIVDADGETIARNRMAEPFASGRHGDALVEAAVQARMKDALVGQTTDQKLRLHGTPERVINVIGTPLVVEGELIGAIVLVEDSSEHDRIDSIRRDFVANVSHELRTPVGALSLLAETLEGEQDPEVVARFLGRIQGETERLSRLIDDLLDLSRIEGGMGDQADSADLASIVSEAVGGVREAAAHKEITISLELDESGLSVIGDRHQLVSAMTNLLENAVKYSAAATEVGVRLVSHGDEVAIAVVDTGIGIPTKDRTRVFERFYRVDRGRSKESGGTGLGLSIVRHVAVNHGGRVELVSQEGQGSTFTMILPKEIRNVDRETV